MYIIHICLHEIKRIPNLSALLLATSLHYKHNEIELSSPSTKGFPGGSAGKKSACNVGDLGSVPGLGRSPGETNGYPLQYSCMENYTDRRALWTTVHADCKKSET